MKDRKRRNDDVEREFVRRQYEKKETNETNKKGKIKKNTREKNKRWE